MARFLEKRAICVYDMFRFCVRQQKRALGRHRFFMKNDQPGGSEN